MTPHVSCQVFTHKWTDVRQLFSTGSTSPYALCPAQASLTLYTRHKRGFPSAQAFYHDSSVHRAGCCTTFHGYNQLSYCNINILLGAAYKMDLTQNKHFESLTVEISVIKVNQIINPMEKRHSSEANCSSANQIIPTCYTAHVFISAFAAAWNFFLSRTTRNQTTSIPPYSFNTHFNTVFPSKPKSSKFFFSYVSMHLGSFCSFSLFFNFRSKTT